MKPRENRPGPRRKRAGDLQLLAILAALGACLATASLAQAAPARFTYELCDSALPGGNPPPASFTVGPGVPFTPFQTCAQPGGSIGIVETGPTAASFAWWSLAIPATPGGYVESVAASGSASGLGPGNNHTYAYEQGWPQNNAGESTRVFQNSEGEAPFYFSLPIMRIFMNCDGNYAPGCGAGPAIAIHYITATEVDPNPPAIAKVEGPLLAGGVLRGHQALSALAGDVGGGLSKLEVLVNGLPAAAPTAGACAVAAVANTSYKGVAAVSPSPCPPALGASWLLDTAAYPFHEGSNTVEVCASDLATGGEPNTTCSPPQTLEVDNSCTDSPIAGGEVLSAAFAKSNSEAVTVPYRHPAEVTGALADNAGDPISGATICIQARTQGASGSPVPLATTTTDAHGQFSYRLAGGPNRRLLVGYRHDSFQVGRSIAYHAHAKPKLRLNHGRIRAGGRVRITGRLPRPRAAGRVVVLQASALHGRRWLTFRRATTGRRGRFHASYRFGATTRTTTYRIRAVVPRQHGYPYDAGHGKPKRVKVFARGSRR